MNPDKLRNVLEAALMAADRPLGLDRLAALFDGEHEEVPTREELREALTALGESYGERGLELREVASGFRIQVRTEYADYLNRLWEEKPPRASRALLETLAIIAYRQPITRGEIEDIRGVSVASSIMRTLLEREWIRVAGHRDVPGRPAVYTTTRAFLDYFNLNGLSELPSLAELRDIDDVCPDLFADQGGEGGRAPADEGTGGGGDTAPSGGDDDAPEAVAAGPEAAVDEDGESHGVLWALPDPGGDVAEDADPVPAAEAEEDDGAAGDAEAPAPPGEAEDDDGDGGLLGERATG